MKLADAGRLIINTHETKRDFSGSSIAKLQVPAAVAAHAGLVVGETFRIEPAGERSFRIVADDAARKRFPPCYPGKPLHPVQFGPSSAGLPDVHCYMSPVALVADANGVLATLAEDWQSYKKPFDSKPPQTTYMDACAGYHGAARALAPDGYRNLNQPRPVNLGQLATLLRNAGVEQLSQRPWRLDGRTVNLSDLAEAARHIDANAVLVAEAA